MALKQVKEKIDSVNNIRQVTKAMEAVSAVKMRGTQTQVLASRPYATAALSILKRLIADLDIGKHPLAESRSVKNILVVVIAGDKGLCGSLNASVFARAEKAIAEQRSENSSVGISVVAIGAKAREFATRRGYEIFDSREHLSDTVSASEIDSLSQGVIEAFLQENFDRVVLVYPSFISTFEQDPVARVMLPIDSGEVAQAISDILPERGKFSEESSSQHRRDPRGGSERAPYLVEPDEASVLAEILPTLAGVLLYHGLLEAKASEHSARMVAMKNASDKAGEMSEALGLQYNKERQAIITREVSEIVGGIETT